MRFLKLQFKDLSPSFWLILLILTGIIIYFGFQEYSSILALICALSGIYYALLIGQKKIIGYAFGILYCVCYLIIAFLNKLYGDLMLTLFYLPLNFFGIYSWLKHQNATKTQIKITSLSKKLFFIYLLTFFLITYLYALFLKNLGANFYILNSCSTIAQLFAFYLQIKRYVENYLFVTFANLIWILIWLNLTEQNQGNILQLINVLIFFFIGIYYFFNWKKEVN